MGNIACLSKSSGRRPKGPAAPDAGSSRDNVERMWANFASSADAAVLSDDDAVDRFFDAIELSPDGFESLVVQYYLGAKELLCFERAAFFAAMEQHKVDSLAGLKSAVAQWLRAAGDSADVFRDVYRFAFTVLRETDENSRGLPIPTAVEALRMLLSAQHPAPHRFAHTDSFIAFLTEQTDVKMLNLDQWMLFLDFSKTVPEDFSGYDPTEAWPVLLDDFVNWSKRRALTASAQSALARRSLRSSSSSTASTTSTSTSTTTTTTTTSTSSEATNSRTSSTPTSSSARHSTTAASTTSSVSSASSGSSSSSSGSSESSSDSD